MIRLAVLLVALWPAALAAQDDAARDSFAAAMAGARESAGGEEAAPPVQPDIAGNLAVLLDFYRDADPAQRKAFEERYGTLFTESYAQALEAEFTYRANGYAHRSAVFGWQLQSSRMIFWTVIVLVAAGLVFSWMQFKLGLDQARTTGKALDMRADMESSGKGIKMSSNVVGLVILALSMGFFYLYLVYVYPISETF